MNVRITLELMIKHVNEINHVNKTWLIVNNEIIPEEVDLKYKRKSASQLLLSDEEREYLKKLKIRVLEDNLVSKSSGYSRHNEDKLAKLILENF